MDYLKNIVKTRPNGKALMGMDVGKKTIGIALSDPAHSIATPLTTIQRTKFSKDLKEIEAIAQEFDIGGFVIGLPVNMDGSQGPRCQSIRDFAAELQNQITQGVRGTDGEIWIALQDERLSTVSADNIVDNLVEKRKTKIKAKSSGLIDKLAAQTILQSALDFITRHKA